MDSQSFNIAIIPPKVTADRAIAVSKVFQDRGGLFVLDGIANHPHITLYIAQLPLSNLKLVTDTLAAVLALQPTFSLHSIGYRNNTYAFIDVAYENSDLVKLQAQLISNLNSLREGIPLPYPDEELSNMSDAERRNVELYGTRSVGETYHPHLTFTVLPQYQETALEGIESQDFSFIVARVGLFRLGEYGTCRQLLHTFELGGGVE